MKNVAVVVLLQQECANSKESRAVKLHHAGHTFSMVNLLMRANITKALYARQPHASNWANNKDMQIRMPTIRDTMLTALEHLTLD